MDVPAWLWVAVAVVVAVCLQDVAVMVFGVVSLVGSLLWLVGLLLAARLELLYLEPVEAVEADHHHLQSLVSLDLHVFFVCLL